MSNPRSAKFYGLCLKLAAVIVLAGAGPNNTILVDNFNDGDAVGWDQNDATGVGTFNVVSGAYVVASSSPIPVDDPTAGAIESHWLRSLSEHRFSNGTLRGTIRATSHGTTLGFLLRDYEQNESDYGFFGSTSFGTFYIERFELAAHPEAPQTILAMADPGQYPFVAGQTYTIEASVVGNRITMTAWRVGEPRPSQPTLSVTDKLLKAGPGNRLSVLVFFDPAPLMDAGVTQVQVGGTFDDITFTPGASR